MKRRSFTVEEGDRPTLAVFVARKLGCPEAEGQTLVNGGAVYVGGRRVQAPSVRLSAGQQVLVVLSERGKSAFSPIEAASGVEVVYEDSFLLAVSKPAGLLAQPSAMRRGDSLFDWVRKRVGEAAGLVHRLDRETSGVVVFAKTAAASRALAEAFRRGLVRKRYLAVVSEGLPLRGEIDLPISKDPARPGRFRATRAANGKPSLTEYERLYSGTGFALVALFPRTGRTHQLRAHLAALRSPILGDRLYGGPAGAAGLAAARCLLHAQSLRVAHPVSGRELVVEARLPEDMAAYFRLAGVAEPSGSH